MTKWFIGIMIALFCLSTWPTEKTDRFETIVIDCYMLPTLCNSIVKKMKEQSPSLDFPYRFLQITSSNYNPLSIDYMIGKE